MKAIRSAASAARSPRWAMVRLPAASAALLVTCSSFLVHADEAEQERLASEEAVEVLQDQPEPRPRRSIPMMTFGIVLSGVGGLNVLLGAVLGIGSSFASRGASGANGGGVFVGMAIGGGVAALAGVPFIVHGARRAPDTSEVTLAPRIAIGPTGVSAQIAF